MFMTSVASSSVALLLALAMSCCVFFLGGGGVKYGQTVKLRTMPAPCLQEVEGVMCCLSLDFRQGC